MEVLKVNNITKQRNNRQMKREIKFRAWDENKMIYDGDRIYPSFFTRELKDVCSPVLVSNRDVTFWVHESKLKHSDITYFDHISYLPIKAIMQFTGLKDKNGKEIYEGDIVSCADIIVAVTWKDAGFQIITNESQGASMFVQERAKHFKVIGNIYENPELL